jgi:hypothetical protein
MRRGQSIQEKFIHEDFIQSILTAASYRSCGLRSYDCPEYHYPYHAVDLVERGRSRRLRERKSVSVNWDSESRLKVPHPG